MVWIVNIKKVLKTQFKPFLSRHTVQKNTILQNYFCCSKSFVEKKQ